MTPQALYNHLYSWATQFLPIELACPIIRSHQDAPAPQADAPYLVIEDSLGWVPQGTTTIGPLVETTPDNYSRNLVTDYEVTVVLWELRGQGERLQSLRHSLDLLNCQSLYQSAKVSVLKTGPIQKVPTLLDSRWLHQHRLELTLGVTGGVSEAINPIETVEFINQIGGM